MGSALLALKEQGAIVVLVYAIIPITISTGISQVQVQVQGICLEYTLFCIRTSNFGAEAVVLFLQFESENVLMC